MGSLRVASPFETPSFGWLLRVRPQNFLILRARPEGASVSKDEEMEC
jgi:hypothetical protein